MIESRRGIVRRLWDNLATRTIGYYVVLFGGIALARQYAPGAARLLVFPPLEPGVLLGGRTTPPITVSGGVSNMMDQIVPVATAMTVAGAVALPVAWLYVLTRQKKGFRQSLVQSLIILPLVVAGVVVLVKNSLALAFALAGIVAAVRFRNTLEDSKDAVYIFLATGLGLAAGVDPPVALAVSFIFNVAIMLMWYTDFGRTSAVFEGAIAEQRLDEARRFAGRQSSFITMLDDEILKSLSAEQLDVVAEKAKKRSRQASPDQEDEEPDFDVLLRIRTTNTDEAKRIAESVLSQHLKKWRFSGVDLEGNGVQVVEYAVRLRKNTTPNMLLEALKTAGSGQIVGVELQ